MIKTLDKKALNVDSTLTEMNTLIIWHHHSNYSLQAKNIKTNNTVFTKIH